MSETEMPIDMNGWRRLIKTGTFYFILFVNFNGFLNRVTCKEAKLMEGMLQFDNLAEDEDMDDQDEFVHAVRLEFMPKQQRKTMWRLRNQRV